MDTSPVPTEKPTGSRAIRKSTSAPSTNSSTRCSWRKTFEAAREAFKIRGMRVVVFSRTLQQEECPGVSIVANGVEETVASLKKKPGKDIWLFGGGLLFRSLLGAGLVDSVELALIPVLLGGGIPLLTAPAGLRESESNAKFCVQVGHRHARVLRRSPARVNPWDIDA